MTSSITVGIPFYSGSKPGQLQAAVDSILNQSLCPDEVHLIQDGSISKELSLVVQKSLKKPAIARVLNETEVA